MHNCPSDLHDRLLGAVESEKFVNERGRQVPARAAAAAAVARVLAGLPPRQRHNLSSSSEELSSIYGSKPQDRAVDEPEKEFFEEEFDPVRHILERIPSEENEPAYFEEQESLCHTKWSSSS